MLKWSADNIYFGEAFYSIWEIRKVEFRRFTSELYDWKQVAGNRLTVKKAQIATTEPQWLILSHKVTYYLFRPTHRSS